MAGRVSVTDPSLGQMKDIKSYTWLPYFAFTLKYQNVILVFTARTLCLEHLQTDVYM